MRLLATNLDRSAGESKSVIELDAAAGRFIPFDLEVEVVMGLIETECYIEVVTNKNKPIVGVTFSMKQRVFATA